MATNEAGAQQNTLGKETYEHNLEVSHLTELGRAAYDYVTYGDAEDLQAYDLQVIQDDITQSRNRKRTDPGEPKDGQRKPGGTIDYRTDAEREINEGLRTAMHRDGYGGDPQRSLRFSKLAAVLDKGAPVKLFEQFMDDESSLHDWLRSSSYGTQQETDRKRLSQKGACRDAYEIMFKERTTGDTRLARITCMGCGVMDLCGVAVLAEGKAATGIWASMDTGQREELAEGVGGYEQLKKTVRDLRFLEARSDIMEAFLGYQETLPAEIEKAEYEEKKHAAKKSKKAFDEYDEKLEALPSSAELSTANIKKLAAGIASALAAQGLDISPEPQGKKTKAKNQKSTKAA